MVITNVSSVGDTNKYAILEKIRESNGISREQLAHELELSAPAVSKNVGSLLSAGIIYEHAASKYSRIGRRPIDLYYNYDIMYVIGLTIMPTQIKGMLADFQGNVLAEYASEAEIDKGVDATLGNLESVIEKLMDEAPSKKKIKCICVANPGVGENTLMSNLMAACQSEWEKLDLAAILGEKYDAEIVLMNDVELDLIGECWKGAGKGKENVLLVKCGDGLACRAMVNGHVFTGVHRASGEIARYVRSFQSENPASRLTGSMELKLCKTLTQQYLDCGGDLKGRTSVTLKQLIRRSAENDKAAETVLRTVMEDLAVMMTNIVLVLDMEDVILSGETAFFTEKHIAWLQEYINKNTLYPIKIHCSKLLESSSLYGAIYVAIKSSEKYLAQLWKEQ